jgi:hypothetical protein
VGLLLYFGIPEARRGNAELLIALAGCIVYDIQSPSWEIGKYNLEASLSGYTPALYSLVFKYIW